MTTHKVEQGASKPSEILTTIREVLLTLARYAKMTGLPGPHRAGRIIGVDALMTEFKLLPIFKLARSPADHL